MFDALHTRNQWCNKWITTHQIRRDLRLQQGFVQQHTLSLNDNLKWLVVFRSSEQIQTRCQISDLSMRGSAQYRPLCLRKSTRKKGAAACVWIVIRARFCIPTLLRGCKVDGHASERLVFRGVAFRIHRR